jgi:hypothetical protein
MDSYAFEAEFTAVKHLGITPYGLRIDVEFAGLVTDGATSPVWRPARTSKPSVCASSRSEHAH